MPSPRVLVHLPHLSPFDRQPLLFITTCTAGRRPLLASTVVQDVLLDLWVRSAAIDGWFVGRYVLMPDHVHFFAKASLSAKPLAAWMKSWKSISARRLIAMERTIAPVWQADYFDHFVRSAAAYESKWEYVLQNPVRKKLCTNSGEWPYRGVLHELCFR